MQQHLPPAVLKQGNYSIFRNVAHQLQQHLPPAVLKPIYANTACNSFHLVLQQHLPLAVLKLYESLEWVDTVFRCNNTYRLRYWNSSSVWQLSAHILIVAIVLIVYGIETLYLPRELLHWILFRCNSTYRLRYAPKGARQQRSKATMRSAHLKYLNEEKVKRRWWSNSTYCLRYWNFKLLTVRHIPSTLQQYLPFMVYAEGCETAEE